MASMRPLLVLALIVPATCYGADRGSSRGQAAVMAPVEAFYRAYDQGFVGAADFATADWNHINPGGGRTRGKAAVLAEVRAVHQSFLKGVTDTIEHADIRFASPTVAVVTVLSRTSAFAMPNESAASVHGQIRTFVVVRRGGSWLVMQDHNTNVPMPAAQLED
jgi:uncharacterized protein (TIGR02246 family)